MGCSGAKHTTARTKTSSSGRAEETAGLFDHYVSAEDAEKPRPLARSSYDTYCASKEKSHPTAPDRGSHEKYVKALDKFLAKVDDSPERFIILKSRCPRAAEAQLLWEGMVIESSDQFEEIVEIYRDKSGFRQISADNTMTSL